MQPIIDCLSLLGKERNALDELRNDSFLQIQFIKTSLYWDKNNWSHSVSQIFRLIFIGSYFCISRGWTFLRASWNLVSKWIAALICDVYELLWPVDIRRAVRRGYSIPGRWKKQNSSESEYDLQKGDASLNGYLFASFHNI